MSAAKILTVYLCIALAMIGTVAGVSTGLSYFTHQAFFGMDTSALAVQIIGSAVSALLGLMILLLLDKQLGKRYLLFIAMNLLVVTSISLLVHVFHGEDYLTKSGLDYPRLALYCMTWGMAGSLISLALSRWQVKWLMDVKVLKQCYHQYDGPKNKEEWLLLKVQELSERAGLPVTPEVGIWNEETFNAFATGPSKSRSLVAVSSAMLDAMPADQLEAVLGHEIAHIANGDMVTMTLLQGTMNAFAMFGSRVAGFAVQKAANTDSEWPYYVSRAVFEWVFMILGAVLLCWFSRKREFRADLGGAQIAGKEKMIAALMTLQERDRLEEKQKEVTAKSEEKKDQAEKESRKRHPEAVAALMISSTTASKLLALFNTHPPLETRIDRLQQLDRMRYAIKSMGSL